MLTIALTRRNFARVAKKSSKASELLKDISEEKKRKDSFKLTPEQQEE